MTICKKNNFSSFLRRNGTALLITAGLFYLLFMLVFRFRSGGENYDYLNHAAWALALSNSEILSSFYDGSERLWHICVKLLFTNGVSNMWAAAAIVTAAADAAAYFLVFKTLDKTLPEKFPRWLLAVLVGAVFFVNALNLPGGSAYKYKGAVNTWHNPTNLMVRPFAAAVFYMTVNIYHRRRYGAAEEDGRLFVFEGSLMGQFKKPVYTRAELVLYPLCLLLSTYAKPSFLQFFAPAILIFLLIDVFRSKGQLLPFCLKLALSFLPAAVILYTQFFGFFGGSSGTEAAQDASSGIAVYFIQQSFSGIGNFAAAIGGEAFNFLLLCAFPLAVFCAAPKRFMQNTACRLSAIGLAVGWMEALMLHETGERASHGNMLWGYYLALWMFWSAAMGQYIRLLPEKSVSGRVARWIGTPLLLWHLISGIAYVATILQTGIYYY